MPSITANHVLAQEEQISQLPIVGKSTDAEEEASAAYMAYMEMLHRELEAANWTPGYSQMPDLVRQDKTLSPKAKIIYGQLLSYMWFKSDRCWPSQQTLADTTGYSRRTVIRACAELYERGYVEKWRRGQGLTNYYFVNPLTFPRSFRRSEREPAAHMVLPATAPELQQDMSSAPPRSIDAVLALCQPDTSRSDNGAQAEAPGSHTNQTKEKQTQEKNISSNDSTSEKGMGIGGVTIRNCKQPNGEGTEINNRTVTQSSKTNYQPSHKEQAAAERAKTVKRAESENQESERAAAIAATTGIPAEHLAALGVAQEPKRRPTPEFITHIMTYYSTDLGDSKRSIKSNITRATKYYYLIYDYCPDPEFREDPEGYFTQILAAAKVDAYHCTNIHYRNGNRFNRMPAFFGCLENRLNLTSEERAYLRSDAPLLYPAS